MKLIDNIKDKLGLRKIKKYLKSKKRNIRITNFANAKSIGIIYPISTTDYQDFINKYIDFLRGEIGFKKIVSLGYYEGAQLPNFIVNDLFKYKYFTKKQLDFSRFGKSYEVKEFIKEDFEILVDLSRDFVVPIKHVVANSHAGLKIGWHSIQNEKYFDFMVEMNKTAPVSHFIKEVNAFLTKVKPKR
ncbi:MAG: hypothetical protein P8N07_11745 [Flavobacteriales bacterium]|jgi:hypothetical protein|nr:hypothetical protein [Flavobacteriales bacterium]|tara:strand:- start:658 stop:1218 length:561 start_codon:yes stop_codon:yes gene_type:complete